MVSLDQRGTIACPAAGCHDNRREGTGAGWMAGGPWTALRWHDAAQASRPGWAHIGARCGVKLIPSMDAPPEAPPPSPGARGALRRVVPPAGGQHRLDFEPLTVSGGW